MCMAKATKNTEPHPLFSQHSSKFSLFSSSFLIIINTIVMYSILQRHRLYQIGQGAAFSQPFIYLNRFVLCRISAVLAAVFIIYCI